ncbi:3D domain-containing protein [Lysinibacillus sphaericus]|uniref:3D domain-containing protein n=1 Tax=Lysinibacillus sphaericus TaxID=1421 RepID=UPI002161DCD2|nr:3D domain-containing protein [Lysinibacillus sphaericus]MCS1382559.1 3D domain-containing protein [Lysinibacillus sphaericus]
MNVYKAITFIVILLFMLKNFTLENKITNVSSDKGEELLQYSSKHKLAASMDMIRNKAITLRQERLQIEKKKQKIEHETMHKKGIIPVEQNKNSFSKEEGQINSNPENQETSSKKWMQFNASYYGPDCNGCSGITVTGINVHETYYYNGMRIVAVDPKVISLGTIVEIRTPYESFIAIAADKGGAIKGFKLDILVESEKIATQYGRHAVQLRIVQLP